jgi:hypothetical protein
MDSSEKEGATLEAEMQRLLAQPKPRRWDRASWLYGAAYAIGWVIARRGANVPPLDAASYFMPELDEPARPPRPLLCKCGSYQLRSIHDAFDRGPYGMDHHSATECTVAGPFSRARIESKGDA